MKNAITDCRLIWWGEVVTLLHTYQEGVYTFARFTHGGVEKWDNTDQLRHAQSCPCGKGGK